jgi:predicted amidohydrolase
MEECSMSQCSILACQVSVPETRSCDDRDNHVDRISELISQKLSVQCSDLVVLPELSTVEYSRQSFSILKSLAETLDGRSVRVWQEVAKKYSCHIVFGMPRIQDDQYRISQIVIDSNGNVGGYYDKLHMCQYGASMEKDFFSRGESLHIFSINNIRFSPIICYDIRMPELSRTLTLDHSVDCILHSGAYFRDESFDSWKAFVTTRSMENQIYLLSLNRAGVNFGQSMFASPWTDQRSPIIMLDDTAECFERFTVSSDCIRAIRRNYTFLADKLDHYEAL